MENLTKFESNRRRWVVQLALTTALALLFLAVTLLGMRGLTPARAAPGDVYVDGASGLDNPTCGTTITPCQTISYTLSSQVTDGDTVLITAGTYTENLTISGITLTLRGGYVISDSVWFTSTNETVVDGGDADRVFFVHDSDSVLEDLTISGGAADGSECWGDAVWVTNANVTIRSSTIKDNNGGCNGIEVNHDFGPGHLSLQSSTVSNLRGNGALHVWGDNASASVVGVTFIGNMSGDVGGAIHIDGASSAVISNSRVISNSANNGSGGIAVRDGASAVISNSQIYSNTSFGGGGGGLGISEAILSLSDSSVMDNSAPNGQSGGIDVGSGSSVTVADSIIADNWTKDHGGAATIDPNATLHLTNALITGNATTSGNANVFAVGDGHVTVMNSTISDNNPQGAQAVILWSGHLTITNSILWNNALNLQGDPPCPTCFTVTYSDIEGSWTGTGNIDADPLFVGGGDYRLQMGSPAIDVGKDAGAPDHDLDHHPRPQDGDGDGISAVDMGAYEFSPYRNYLPITLKN